MVARPHHQQPADGDVRGLLREFDALCFQDRAHQANDPYGAEDAEAGHGLKSDWSVRSQVHMVSDYFGLHRIVDKEEGDEKKAWRWGGSSSLAGSGPRKASKSLVQLKSF